ncbi:hypothetical protein E6C27_scaffold98G001630 [Cucumis melo var. makuwa]|uniref:Uncharacterized protein n=1 Tax=Cucumis melo var. makuwa TaxID=1194695 RepID=A0A5A7UXR3_CUCMM|nr:hypothetical protein E6C27_scaffold98G001630 [Cucumis melo var. makuwa]
MGDWVMVVAVVAERISAYSFSLLALDIDTVKVTVVAEREQFLCDKEKAAGASSLPFVDASLHRSRSVHGRYASREAPSHCTVEQQSSPQVPAVSSSPPSVAPPNPCHLLREPNPIHFACTRVCASHPREPRAHQPSCPRELAPATRVSRVRINPAVRVRKPCASHTRARIHQPRHFLSPARAVSPTPSRATIHS